MKTPRHPLTLWAICLFFAASASPAPADDVPTSVTALWSDFDPRRDPLEVEVIREWREDGAVYRSVRFLVGHFKGKPARLAAFYGYPASAAAGLPGVMHIHGGGQRASLDEVKALVPRGYAVLSVNWGGREMEGALPDEPNTDWGAVDPTQKNVPGYSSLLPGPLQYFEDREHPKNCNWYLLTLGCRRGLTFLEQQPEVDPDRLGIHGYSMGGNLTMYVAGTDDRVKAAVPAVGGQGWRWEAHPFIGGSATQQPVTGDLGVFRRTLSFESYAPLIRCPILHRSATNDFHGWMDDVYRTNALIEGQPVRHAWSPHFNHRLTPEVAITMPLWFEHFLKGGPALPATPASRLTLNAGDGIPSLRVTPDTALPAARCDIYYSVDPDPRARFWRSAEVTRDGDAFVARLPLHAVDAPLFAFANVLHTLPRPESFSLPGLPREIPEVCVSSDFHSANAAMLADAGVRATEQTSLLIDDFSGGWRDWYRLNEAHRPLWQNWTRKVTDPKWRGPKGAKLAITLTAQEPNHITVVVVENEWRNYRGRRTAYISRPEVAAGGTPCTLLLAASDFKTPDGTPLANWDQLDLLGLCAVYEPEGAKKSPPPSPWVGDFPRFHRVEWVIE